MTIEWLRGKKGQEDEGKPLSPEVAAESYRRKFSDQVKNAFSRLQRERKNIEAKGYKIEFSKDGKTVTLTRAKSTSLDHEVVAEIRILENPDNAKDYSSIKIIRTTESIARKSQTAINIFQLGNNGIVVPLSIERGSICSKYGDPDIEGNVRLVSFETQLTDELFKVEIDPKTGEPYPGQDIEKAGLVSRDDVFQTNLSVMPISKRENIGKLLVDSTSFFVR